ncbi:eukaryotic mitochondrial regulator protein-domain-containing protein [Aspergillus granulosus]|uniref:Eukaryotic mitochondrial regulator protein-domain-containing protein n=1 Tax=Aspergillus granulosus TaxID=176169 RepID=A0ABR4HCP2_9EURO
MPPRIHSPIVPNSLLSSRSSASQTSTHLSLSSPACTPLSKLPCSRHSASPLSSAPQQSSRSFSSTPTAQTRLRQEMFQWLGTKGQELKSHIPGSTNYITDAKNREKYADGERVPGPSRPFPLNFSFKSEAILSEELRNDIYERVVVQKQSVRAVSVKMGVDMRRVAAVCRLVELEKRWREQGKPLALPYARAVHEMVPTTPLYDKEHKQRERPHEEINDLPAHRLTDPQIFYPTSESRQFTRVDAGRVFSAAPARLRGDDAYEEPWKVVRDLNLGERRIETVGKGEGEQRVLQPADVRIPHPQLITLESERAANPDSPRDVWTAYEKRLKEGNEAEEKRKLRKQEARDRQVTRIQPESSRFEFRIKDVIVSKETTGLNGRNPQAPGRRYGVPKMDRKKGQVKIPTQVLV